MRSGRTTLAVTTAMVFGAIAAPAASAAIAVTQTASPDPVDQGGTVTVQTTLTNGPTAEPDARAHVKITRPGTQTPVDSTYLTFTTSLGTCTFSGGSAECLFGAVPANASIQLTATVQANESFAQTVVAYKCTAPPACDFQTDLGTGASISQVDYPTEFSGSNKIKLTGVPATCTNSAFKAKAKVKAKKVTRTYAYLKGPKSEFGTPLPVSGEAGRIAKKKGRKLKVDIPANSLDPGFYELRIAAKRKGGQLKRTATFQVCGPTFGI